jgi:hypothetical protein
VEVIMTRVDERFEWLVSFCSDREMIGRKFRPSDVQYGTWPDGTIFTNVRTGEVRVCIEGRVERIRGGIHASTIQPV